MLTAYSEAAHTVFHEGDGAAGVLLLLPTSAFPFDRATYPFADYSVLLATDGPGAAEALLAHVPRDRSLVFKLQSPDDRLAVARAFPIERITAYRSYTAPPGYLAQADPAVLVAERPDPRVFELFVAQGQHPDELRSLFAAGHAVAFSIDEGGGPVAVCLAYRNHGPVYEIGGLVTLPPARRRGLARRLVQTALHELARREAIPRYQVHEDNLPSVALAERLRLVRFLTMEHWRYDGQPAA